MENQVWPPGQEVFIADKAGALGERQSGWCRWGLGNLHRLPPPPPAPMAFHDRKICTTSWPAGWFWAGFVVHFNTAWFIGRVTALYLYACQLVLLSRQNSYRVQWVRKAQCVHTVHLQPSWGPRRVCCGAPAAEAPARLTLFWHGKWMLGTVPWFSLPYFAKNVTVSPFNLSSVWFSRSWQESLCLRNAQFCKYFFCLLHFRSDSNALSISQGTGRAQKGSCWVILNLFLGKGNWHLNFCHLFPH